MSNFKDGCYSCTAGTELLAKVIAGKCQMHYTRAAVGCGKIPTGKTPETMTEPADYVMDAIISNVSIPVDGQCQVTIQINSKNVETGFWATCILLYAQDPDIGEIPYTYLVLENNPERIKSADSEVGKLAVFDLITSVGAIENVSADIAPDAVVTRSEVDDIVSRKVDKVSGKGLSTEDFTTAEKNKLSGIAPGASAVSSSDTNGNVKINGVETTVYTHPSGTNPHGTTKADVGLGNVGNYKAVSTSSQSLTDSEKDQARTNIDAAQLSDTYNKQETQQLISQKIAEIIADAPENFDTLKEISDWISSHSNSAAAMNSAIQANTAAINTKVDKVTGKGLSTEDFTTAQKNKLSGIEAGAQVNSVTGIKGNAESSYRTGAVNLTPANIGASPSDHTHYYAGSSSAGGAANSAVKFQTARAINGVSFDGTANILVPKSPNLSMCSNNSGGGQTGYLKICSIVFNTQYLNSPVELMIHQRDNRSYKLIMGFSNAASAKVSVEFANYISYTNCHPSAYYVDVGNSAQSIFDIYVRKVEPYDRAFLVDVCNSVTTGAHHQVVFEYDFVSALPSGAVAFTLGTTITKASSIADYNNLSNTIQVGYSGASVALNDINFPAVYTENGSKIKETSFETFLNKMGASASVGSEITYASASELSAGKITVSGLFTNYKVILATITSSKYGTHQYVLPMPFIKSRGNSGYQIISKGQSSATTTDQINFLYVDDNSIRWFEYQNQGAATYSYASFIKLF